MKQWQHKVQDILNIWAIIDDAKCFDTVRELRWPQGVRCVGWANNWGQTRINPNPSSACPLGGVSFDALLKPLFFL